MQLGFSCGRRLQTTLQRLCSGESGDSFEDGVERGRGAAQRKITDVEPLYADFGHSADGSCADINWSCPAGKLGGKELSRNRQELTELTQGSRVGTPVVEDSKE